MNDFSKIPVNKKVINKTGNTVIFDMRDVCKQVKIEIENNDNISLTIETSEALRLLYKKAEQLNLIIEDDKPEPRPIDPTIKHTVTIVNNNTCVDYLNYKLTNTNTSTTSEITLNKDEQTTIELNEGIYSLEMLGPNHYMSGDIETLVTVEFTIDYSASDKTYNFGVEELVINNETNYDSSISIDSDKSYHKFFYIRANNTNGTFISNDIEHNYKLTNHKKTIENNIPIHENQGIYTITITTEIFE